MRRNLHRARIVAFYTLTAAVTLFTTVELREVEIGKPTLGDEAHRKAEQGRHQKLLQAGDPSGPRTDCWAAPPPSSGGRRRFAISEIACRRPNKLSIGPAVRPN